jgi:hypothetical protein
MMTQKILVGKLLTYSEQGFEGGYLCIQDLEYITLDGKRWDFKGLNTLKETDYLKVYALDSEKVICEGQVNKIPLSVFSGTLKGHFEQIKDKSADWEIYFEKHYHAELHREIK